MRFPRVLPAVTGAFITGIAAADLVVRGGSFAVHAGAMGVGLGLVVLAHLRREDVDRLRAGLQAVADGGLAGLRRRVAIWLRMRAAGGRQWLTRDRAMVYGTATAIFAAHFWLQWVYTYRFVEVGGGLGGILNKFNIVFIGGLDVLTRPGIQINNYSGNPFFLYPVIELLGYSPDAVRATLIGANAATGTLFFLSFHRLFGFKRALLGTAVLYSMGEWVYWRWFDHTYAGLLIAALFFLYVEWVDRGADPRSPYLYVMAFLGGLFFYFKATVLYLVGGMGLGTLYREGVRIFREAPLAPLAVLFLLGASPFIAYNLMHMDHIGRTVGSSSEISVGGPVDASVTEAVVGRFDQLGRWMRSDVYNLDDALLRSPETMDFYPFGYPFTTKNGPGGEIEAGETIDVWTTLTGIGYERHHFNGTHPLSVLFVLGLLALVVRRRHVHLVVIFLVLFLAHIVLPASSGFRTGHMNVVLPFTVLILLAALDTVPERFRRHRAYRAGGVVTVAVLLLSMGVTASALHVHDDPQWWSPEPNATWQPGEPENVPLHRWGGDQRFYEEFRALDVDGPVLTNSFRVQITSQYLRGLNSIYLVPGNVTEEDLVDLPQVGGSPLVVGDFRHLSTWKTAPYPLDTPVTVIVRQDLPCRPGIEFCGERTGAVLEKFGLDPATMERMTVYNETYLIARNVTG